MLTQQARYRQHPARYPTIGYLDEFRALQRPEIYAFYKRMYVPNNMVFVVVGDVDKNAVVKQLAELWKDASPAALPKLSFPIEPLPEKPSGAQGMADIRQPELRLAWPGTRQGGDGDTALDVLGVILGGGESSRLVHAVRDAGLASGVSAYNASFPWGEGFFGIDANVTPQMTLAATRPDVPAAIASTPRPPSSIRWSRSGAMA